MMDVKQPGCASAAGLPTTGRRSLMPRILLVIPISALIIAGLVGYKLTRPPTESLFPTAGAAGSVRPAPLFVLYDEHSELVRLARSYGRQKMLIVFFDGRQGPDRSELLQSLRRDFGKIHEAGALVLAISAARPAEHRAGIERDGKFPFPMLSDLDYQVHTQWGAYDSQTDKPREAVFIVDRAGLIRHTHLGPDQLGTPAEWAGELQQVR